MYGVLNVLIAFCATWIARHGWLKKPLGGVLMVIIFVFIGGGLGALIPWFMDGLPFDSESLSGIIYRTGYFNQAVSHLLSSIIMDIPDKIITVIFAYVIIRLIPPKYYPFFSFKSWMQTPISSYGYTHAEKSDARVMSLGMKMLLVLSISLTTVAIVATGISILKKSLK